MWLLVSYPPEKEVAPVTWLVRFFVLVLGSALLAGCQGQPQVAETRPAAPEPEAVSLLGTPLYRVALDPEIEKDYQRKRMVAEVRFRQAPRNVDNVVWRGRRTAYLGWYQEALAIYSDGLADFPDNSNLLRHRGHRYISTRKLDLAIQDLERAAALETDKPDRVELDGLPNSKNLPRTTLQYNVWYHLGLAHYLSDDGERAVECYRRCLELAHNDDALCAASHWLYMSLRRLGRHHEAQQLLAPIQTNMDIIENHAYHKLLLMYKGEVPLTELESELAEQTTLGFATTGYGIGNWHLCAGNTAAARDWFERIVAQSNWAAFGYIAAEAELARAQK